MDRRVILDLVDTEEARSANTRAVDLHREVPHCDLVLHTPAGYAFFRVIEPRQDVVDLWRQAQGEISRFIDRLSRGGQHEGAYLTLLVEGPSDRIQVHRIMKNPYVCRKLVIPVNDGTTATDLAVRLPFFALPKQMREAIRRPPADPTLAVQGTRLSARFVEEILSRISVEAIADRLDKYLIETEVAVKGGTSRLDRSTVAVPQQVSRLRLTKVQLEGFRNYGPNRTFRLYGDLIVIYGHNGAGKTSICEAVEWALTGRSWRVEQYATQAEIDHSVLVNRGEGVDRAAVRLHLAGPDAKLLDIHRTLTRDAGNASRIRLNDSDVEDRLVLKTLLHLTDEETLPDVRQLRYMFHTLHFITQQELEQFLVAASDAYGAFARMAGTEEFGRLLEKGSRLVAELRRRTRQASELLASHQAQLAAVEQSHHERQASLQGLGVPSLEPAVLRKWRQDVLATARELGLAVTSPSEPHVTVAWRGVAQAILQAVAVRRESLAGDRTRLERLIADADSISEAYRRRTQLEAEYQATERRRAETEQKQAEVGQSLARTRDEMREMEAARERTHQQQQRQRRLQGLRAHRHQLHESSNSLGQKLAAAQAEVVRVEHESGRLAAALQAAEERQERNQAVARDRTQRLNALRQVAESLPGWRQARAERDGIAAELDDLRERWQQLNGDRAAVERDLDACKAKAARLQIEMEEVRRLTEERQGLLSALQRHVHEHDQNCPLCGHDWESPEALRSAIAALGSLIPSALRAAQSMLHAAQEEMGALQVRAKEIQVSLQTVQEHGESLRRRQRELTELVSGGDQAITAVLNGHDPAGLTDAEVNLTIAAAEESDQAIRRHVSETSREIADLRAQAARVAEQFRQQQEKVRTLEVDVAHVQAELDQLDREVVDLEDNRLSQVEPEVAVTNGGSQRESEERLTGLREEVGRLSATAEQLAADHRSVQQLLDALGSKLRAAGADIALVENELRQLGVSEDRDAPFPKRLRAQRRRVEGTAADVDRFETEVQRFSAALEALDLTEQVRATDEQRQVLEAERDRWQREVNQLDKLRRHVEDVLDNAHRLRSEREKEHADLFQPMINLLYQRLSPHPYFGDLDIRPEDGQLHIRFSDGDQLAPVIGYFSQAQQVSVVLSLFLSSALLQGWTRLGTLFIDDPVQHMDDMNVYAFLDLLQGLVWDGRQVVVTTASEELYRTMLGRFSHWRGKETPRFQAIRLEGVTREGPEVTEDTTPPQEMQAGA